MHILALLTLRNEESRRELRIRRLGASALVVASHGATAPSAYRWTSSGPVMVTVSSSPPAPGYPDTPLVGLLQVMAAVTADHPAAAPAARQPARRWRRR